MLGVPLGRHQSGSLKGSGFLRAMPGQEYTLPSVVFISVNIYDWCAFMCASVLSFVTESHIVTLTLYPKHVSACHVSCVSSTGGSGAVTVSVPRKLVHNRRSINVHLMSRCILLTGQ